MTDVKLLHLLVLHVQFGGNKLLVNYKEQTFEWRASHILPSTSYSYFGTLVPLANQIKPRMFVQFQRGAHYY